ncbi:hypothetical protein AVDCRST_MAG84-1385 [uncultured Microcoleus sp.]|uniref:Uncharacterized protein n=1 Tax=uncultured Microcoleus sp. TaxID=259945 RepID=A0A6J4L3W7_9CYAN|nr:hypothetical protein AVDCRST_MAG84-1385 [uncultured Microcoleus sp.]
MTLLQAYEGPPELFGGYERNSPSDRSVQYFSTAANDVKFRIVRSRKLIMNYRLSPGRIDSKTFAK